MSTTMKPKLAPRKKTPAKKAPRHRTPKPRAQASADVAMPRKVAVTAAGDVTEVPEDGPEVSIRPSTEVVAENLHALGQSINDAQEDDRLEAATSQFGQVLSMRIGANKQQPPAAHPNHAATHLEPAVEATAEAMEKVAMVAQVANHTNAADLRRRLKRLRFLKRLYRGLAPVVEQIDRMICNLEQGLNTDVREVYDRLKSLFPSHPQIANALHTLVELVTANAQKARRTRLSNLRKEGPVAPAEVPVVVTPAVAPAPPAPQPAPVSPVVLTAPAPAAPARRKAKR